jgi:hypothetical protein
MQNLVIQTPRRRVFPFGAHSKAQRDRKYVLEQSPMTEQLEGAVLKLMNLARAALDAGDIDMASRLLRLAALASENPDVLQQVTGLPDALLVNMTPDGTDANAN